MNPAARKCYFLLPVLLSLHSVPLRARDEIKERFEDDYKHKFVVALRDGMAVGFFADPTGTRIANTAEVFVEGDQAEVCPPDIKGHIPSFCENTTMQPIHRGEILRVDRIWLDRKRLRFGLDLTTLSPHSIQRGMGAFAHESLEQGRMAINFKIVDPDDYSIYLTEIGGWLKRFESAEEARKFGNTASGVFVREIKLGMTFQEVEQSLGLPQTRVDLGEKVLYKYKDMTVEFHSGKVTEVR